MVIVAAVLIASGMATRYDPGIMEATVANRVMWGHLLADTDPAECVALLDCDRIGDRVWLELDGKVHGPFMVADCAARQDVARLAHLRFAVDLSWELAQKLGVIDRPIYGIKVWDRNPARIGGELE
jgi:hypothetical protein